MKRKSHAAMGHFLLREYLPDLPRRYARIFLLGCVEPDGNPTTYLKGSIRSQWFQGHNYNNASRFLFRLLQRLERKTTFSAWDFYSLGKAIHYTLDAFTYAHNVHFGKGLSHHRAYEVKLQTYFLAQLRHYRPGEKELPESAEVLIRQTHDDYLLSPGSVQTDTEFAISAACSLMRKLTENQQYRKKHFLRESAKASRFWYIGRNSKHYSVGIVETPPSKCPPDHRIVLFESQEQK